MPTTQQCTHDELYLAIERERKRAFSRSLDMSFNELADMCEQGELNISLEYQRIFRWSEEKCSRFIESIALEMPVPPIYAIEVKDGCLELIDGLQRLSTYLYLRGELDLPDRDPPIRRGKDFLLLEGCDIVPELNGFTFEDLPTSLKYRIRRATLRVEIVRRESNPRFAYYMFKRLNTGGESLSEQEIRNCSIRILGSEFNDFIFKLSKNQYFQKCIQDITDEYRKTMGEQELVLRFFAFKNNLAEFVHNIDPFLTDYMERVSDREATNHIEFNYAKEECIFSDAFHVISRTLETKAFCRWANNRYSGGFSKGHFEAFSLGVAKVIDSLGVSVEHLSDAQLRAIEAAMETAKKNPELTKLTVGGGKNFKSLYEKKIELVASAIRAAL